MSEILFPSMASSLFDMFCHRKDAYAVMTTHRWQRDKNGNLRRNYYDRVYEPITEDVINRHLLGEHTIAVFPTRIEDQTVKFLCWDVDVLDEKIFNMFAEKAERTALNYPGSKVGLEASGGEPHRRHIWVFLKDPMSLREARKIVGDHRRIGVDCFPNQDIVIDDFYFELPIKMPLGKHRVSGKYSQFINWSHSSVGA